MFSLKKQDVETRIYKKDNKIIVELPINKFIETSGGGGSLYIDTINMSLSRQNVEELISKLKKVI